MLNSKGERALVYLRVVEELSAITFLNTEGELEEANAIEVAHFGGWKVIVKKNQFEVGELAVFCETDTILNPDIPLFSFLEGKRIRTKKLKGVVSQGVAFTIPEILDVIYDKLGEQECTRVINNECDEGDDWTELVGATKYDEELAKYSKGGVRLPPANAKGNFPSFIPKTDEERIQNLAKELKYDWQGKEVVITEKLDGSSITIYCASIPHFPEEYVIGICSRNLDLKLDSTDSHFIKTGRPYIDKLSEYCTINNRSLALQGEIIGPGIQGNPYKLDAHEIYFFNVYDIDARKRLTPKEATNIINTLLIKSVPIQEVRKLEVDMEHLLELADGMSVLNSKTNREGIVVRALDGSFSFKVISRVWDMKQK